MHIHTPDDESTAQQPADNILRKDVIRTFMAIPSCKGRAKVIDGKPVPQTMAKRENKAPTL
jgi:hypothetical protein